MEGGDLIRKARRKTIERYNGPQYLVRVSGFGVSGFGFRVSGLGLRVQGLGLRVKGSGFWV